MGATRKLQGEIDRVLKKVQEGVLEFDSIWNKVYDTENANQKEKFEADLKKEIKKLQRYRDQIKTWIQSSEIKDKKIAASYEQALIDARKAIEREMERFKVCEKETKTKAFSKEGLGQLPKTDPREKAKAESREWLNNMVDELHDKIDEFESEMEGLAVKKGKTRPPRLVHLEESTSRHKAHITKLELTLRLLDNDQITADQVNEIKELVEDYLERNQEDFDEFADVDEIYSQLPLDKMEAMESLDAAPNVAAALVVKEKAAVAASLTLNGGNTKTLPPPILPAAAPAPAVAPQAQAQAPPAAAAAAEEPASEGRASPIPVASPTAAASTHSTGPDISSSPNASRLVTAPPSLLAGSKTQKATASAALQASSPLPASTGKTKEDEAPAPALTVASASGVPGRRSSTGGDGGLSRSFSRSSPAPPPVAPASQQPPAIVSLLNISSGLTSTNSVPGTPEASKRSVVAEERSSAGVISSQPLSSPMASQSRGFGAKTGGDLSPTGEAATPESSVGSRLGQWRDSPSQFGPDQKQKFLQKLQQVNQQGSPSLLNAAGTQTLTHLSSPVPKPQTPQASSLLQQQTYLQQQQQQQQQLQHSSVVTQVSQSTTTPQAPASLQFQQIPTPAKDAVQSEPALARPLEQQQSPIHSKLPEESSSSSEPPAPPFARNLSLSEDDLKNADTFDVSVGGPGTLAELSQLSRDADFTQVPSTPSSSSSGTGVIGRKELGAIGDNLPSAPPPQFDLNYNLQMLDSVYNRLPEVKDSERPRSYTPRNPAMTPSSYPQVPASFIDNPAIWEKFETDVLFFAFYFQIGSYQQYLAARELKKQSWRFHKKYNTWFQRHEEPKVTTDEYEQGTYVYFDFHVVEDLQQGWVQRIKTEFTFEYSYLEDELVV